MANVSPSLMSAMMAMARSYVEEAVHHAVHDGAEAAMARFDKRAAERIADTVIAQVSTRPPPAIDHYAGEARSACIMAVSNSAGRKAKPRASASGKTSRRSCKKS